MEAQINQAAQWLASARKVIALTGAGVSTESGIPDFRSPGGLWTRYNPAEYGTLGAFLRDPEKVWTMLAEFEELLDARPNAGHIALAGLEEAGVLAGIITQNIDGLHQLAGNKQVVEYHGSNRTYSCLACRSRLPREQVVPLGIPPRCPRTVNGHPCNSLLKPDVVFFDENIPPQALIGAEEMVRGADLILVLGTSCEVYPAAGIPDQVRRQGGKVVEVNLALAADLMPDLTLQGKFSEILPALSARLETLRS